MALPATPGRRDRRRAGTTLAELLGALLIVGILAVITGARVDFNRFRVNSNLSSVITSFTYAQRLAVSLQNDVLVAFDVGNRRLRLHEDRDNDGTIDSGERVTYVYLEDGVTFGRGTAPVLATVSGTDVSFTRRQDGLPVIIFRRDGTASENGGFYITSLAAIGRGYARDARAVVFTRATGRAEAWTYFSGTWQRRT